MRGCEVIDDDGIEVRATSWATFSAPTIARLDMSHLSDEEFDAMARLAVGQELVTRLERAVRDGKTYRVAVVDEIKVKRC